MRQVVLQQQPKKKKYKTKQKPQRQTQPSSSSSCARFNNTAIALQDCLRDTEIFIHCLRLHQGRVGLISFCREPQWGRWGMEESAKYLFQKA